MAKTGYWEERRLEVKARTEKGVLKNKHEREFYNHCFEGCRRSVERNVEYWQICYGKKIAESRLYEIAKMAQAARV